MFEGLPNIVKMALSQTIWLFLLAALFIPLERIFPLHRQPTRRPQLLIDLVYYYTTTLIPTVVLAFPLAVAASTARYFVPDGYYIWIMGLPIWLQIIFAFVVGDFGSYWAHRAMHEVPWLWRFHATHHDPVRMDWLINSRANPIDIIFTRMAGLTLMVVLGFGSVGSGSGSAIPLYALFAGAVWAFFIHSNIRWNLGWLGHVVSTPHFHHWHHSRDDHVNHNYAAILPVYDRLFGTFHAPKGVWPPSYGIAPENQPEVLIAARYEDAPADKPAKDQA
ncbi:sterol desaturase [Sphingomonas sp. SRS2]|nr:sterol desaturase [Sphingomonas sp. SRS2]